MTSVILKPGREKSLLRHHPWVFSGAVEKISGPAKSGETIRVLSSDGTLLALGAYSPESQIIVRIWTFSGDNDDLSPSFFRTKLVQSIKYRNSFVKTADLTAYRLVNAESDGLPGLIVERYNDFLVCQFLSTGAEFWKQAIVDQLNDLEPNEGIYERSDPEIRKKEGLTLRKGVLSGKEPPDRIEIQEESCRFLVDVKNGHKTGFYLDQRNNRRYAGNYSAGKEVLNCFAYTGGFGISALKGGAIKVVNIESSSALLNLARRNAELNGLNVACMENVEGDVFRVLREYRDLGRQFDLIILDPPKFAESRKQLNQACRGYKDINLLAFKLLRPNGLLFTFSCSGLMEPDLFQKIVADAALDAGREVRIIRHLSQSEDHPVSLNFPEGRYLKGLLCSVSP